MSQTLRIMTFNIRHGRGLDGKIDLERIADLIRKVEPHFVGLQEVDHGVDRSHKLDIAKILAELTKMSYAFGKNIDYQNGDYGNAILSKFPIVRQVNLHYRMLRENEQRGLLQTVLDLDGREIVFMNTHIDHRDDDTERLMNVAEIVSTAKSYGDHPIIVCGDFNDHPKSLTIQKMEIDFQNTSRSQICLTFPSHQPKQQIDYIFCSRHLTSVKSSDTIDTIASDHLPLVAEITI